MAADPDSRVKDVLDDILALVGDGGSGSIPLRPVDSYNQLADGLSTMARVDATSSAGQTLATGSMRLTYFTSSKSFTSSQVKVYGGATAAGATPTLVRTGLYSIAADGAGTLVASHASDTAIYATLNTAYAKSWTAPVALVRGTRYAVAQLVVTGAAAPSVAGQSIVSGVSLGGSILATAPRMSGAITGLADLPASFVAASLADVNGRSYVEILT